MKTKSELLALRKELFRLQDLLINGKISPEVYSKLSKKLLTLEDLIAIEKLT